MSAEILGYDCNGKALRPGDIVILIRAHPAHERFVGRSCHVARGSELAGYVLTSFRRGFMRLIAPPKDLCLVTGDFEDQDEQEHEQALQVDPA